jgi:Protein of unknown function (DUF2934)
MPRTSKPQPDAPTGPRLVKQTPSKTTPKTPVQRGITHEQIAMRAYELFLQEGGAHGRHLDHWLHAERELSAFTEQPPKRAATRTRG